MIHRVLQYVREHHMIEEGDCIVAGVSGGADSVCLLWMLLEIRKEIPVEIRVVHVNHLIRADAAEDAAYVRELCRKHQLSFTLVEQDVEALARRLHISTEEAGRNVRYEAFEKELGGKKGRIAIAHNKNDSCETLLFNLFRGTSLKGMAGIRPVRDNIIRPLLCLERREIEAFLKQKGISCCIDSTNLEDNYSRNIIRHHILETAVAKISPAAVSHIGDACERVGEAYALVRDITAKGFSDCVTVVENDGGYRRAFYINQDKYRLLHAAIQGYVIMEVLERAAGSGKDLGSVHVRQVRELMDSQCGRRIHLPHQLCARRVYDGVCICRETDHVTQTDSPAELVVSGEALERALAEELVLDVDGSRRFRARLVRADENGTDLQNIPQKKYTKWFDYDKIKDSIVIRTRRAGDYLTVNSMNQRKSLKAYFIDRKIPQEERSRVWLVADGSHVVWVVGERISSYYKVSEGTGRILSLTFEEDS